VDLDLPAGQHYFPFIRLALARFQPRALPDLRLSSVVLADFVQTAPDRTLTLVRDTAGPGVHRVHVSGASYSARRPAGGGNAVVTTSRMTAQIERRAPEIADDALAWSPLPGGLTTSLATGQLDGTTQHWNGEVAVPPDAAGETLRVVVREEERYDTTTAGRVVYVDAIGL
jgi:hypothetical protein